MSTERLPDGWTRVKFGDVVRKVNDRVDPDTAGIERYVAGEHMDTDDLTIRRWGKVGDGYLGPAFHMRFKPGHVLYGSRRTYLRKVAVADFEGITANTTFVLEPSSPALLPEFLPLVMTTEAFHEHSIKQSKGSVNPYINFSDLTWYEFALPPIAEQRSIVEVLAQADSVVEMSNRAVLTARTSLTQMSIRLTCPTGLPSVPLEGAAEVLDSRRVPVNDAERSRRVGSVPYYGANGQVGLIDAAIFNEPLVLVPEDGGRFSEWRTNPVAYRIDGPSWVNNHAHVLKAKDVPHGWLYFSLRNRDMTHLVVGTTRTKLNRSSLTKIAIAVPEDLARRLDMLEGTDVVRRAAEKHLEDAKQVYSELRDRLVSLGRHDYVQ